MRPPGRLLPALAAPGSRLIITQPSPSTLDGVMKIDELLDKTPEQISEIWLEVRMERHRDNRGRGSSSHTAQQLRAYKRNCSTVCLTSAASFPQQPHPH